MRKWLEPGEPSHRQVAGLSTRKTAMVAIGIGLFLGLLGPFGSYAGPGIGWRMAYWVVMVGLGTVIFNLTVQFAQRLIGTAARLRWPMLVCAAALASVPQTLISRAAASFIWPELPRLGPPLWLWYLQVLLVFVVVSAGLSLSASRIAKTGGEAEDQPLLEPNYNWPNSVIALQMEDHYVRVHRADGSDLILLTMREAMARTVPAEGCQPHRSWWVARRAVQDIVGEPRSMRIRLTNGLMVPVARSKVASLRALDWLI